MRAQVRWAGHVVRTSHYRIPKQFLFGDLSGGKRSVDGQKKRFKNTLKAFLKSFVTDTALWEKLAGNRLHWRKLISKGYLSTEERRTTEAKQKRELRKSRVASTSSTSASDPSLVCPTCGKSFHARIGLISHLRTHRSQSSST